MKKFFVFGAVIVVILILVVSLSYFFIEKPLQKKNLEYTNLNIRVLANNTQLAENYYIFLHNNLLKSGRTLVDGYILEKIYTFNSSFLVFVEGNDIYNVFSYFDNVNGKENKEISMQVEKLNDVDMQVTGKLLVNNPLVLTLTSSSSIKNRLLCFRWGSSIISVSIENYSRVKVPQRLKLDKCYLLTTNLTSLEIPVSYVNYVGTDKFIKFYLVFGDYMYNDTSMLYFESNNSFYKVPDKILEVKHNY